MVWPVVCWMIDTARTFGASAVRNMLLVTKLAAQAV